MSKELNTQVESSKQQLPEGYAVMRSCKEKDKNEHEVLHNYLVSKNAVWKKMSKDSAPKKEVIGEFRLQNVISSNF